MKHLWLLLLSLLIIQCSTFDRPIPKKLTLEKQWVRHTLSEPYIGYRQYHHMTPLIFENMVLQGNANDGFAAYDKVSGNEIWKVKVRDGVEGGAATDANTVYFGGNDAKFYAVDVKTGKVRWTFPVRAQILASPLVTDTAVLFLSGDNTLYSVNKKTGEQNWLYKRQETTSLSIRGGSQPVIVNNRAYVGFSDGYLVALNVQDGGVAWERLLGENRRFMDIDTTPSLSGENVIVGSYDGSIYSISRKDGQIEWSYPEGGYFAVSVADKRIFAATTTGKLVALNAVSGAKIWEKTVSTDGIGTQPILHRGFLVYGVSNGSLEVADAQSGKTLVAYNPGMGVYATPAIDTKLNKIYFMSVDANLHSFTLENRPRAQVSWE